MTKINEATLETLRKQHIERGGQLTWDEISNAFSLNIGGEALRKRVMRYERRTFGRTMTGIKQDIPRELPTEHILKQRQINNIDVEETFKQDRQTKDNMEVFALRSRVAQLERTLEHYTDKVDNKELLYDPYPEHLDDTDAWISWQDDLAEKKEIATVMVWSDIHFPDHSQSALGLAKQFLSVVKPDALVFAGDMFDFDALSTFAKSRRRFYRDAILEVTDMWQDLVYDVLEICPNIKMAAFRGNHDTRIDRWNDMSANPFADSTEETFVSMVRCDNHVWWLGQAQETHFGPLFIQHGKRVGENAAKSMCKDSGWNKASLQGHNHRPGTYIHRSNDVRTLDDYRVVMSVSQGCLCNIPPHYQLDTKQSTWLHGICVAHVRMDGEDVNLNNIVFHRNSDTEKLWGVFGNEIIEEV